MERPEGTVLPGDEGKVMWLRKCLYGLKQAPRQWNILIDGVIPAGSAIRPDHSQLGFRL